jgi:hypothetical protein
VLASQKTRLSVGFIRCNLTRIVRCLIVAILSIILVLSAGRAFARPKTDHVVLKNGDRITCEIKQLARGKLKVKTDDMGTIDIEWDKIGGMDSDFFFRVEDSNGLRVYGSIQITEDAEVLRVVGAVSVASLEKSTVVEIFPIEKGFWDRLSGSLSIGFSYTKASEVAQLTFDWANRVAAEKNRYDFNAGTILTERRAEDSGLIRRYDISFAYYRLLRKKWSGSTDIAFERNDELNLQRRIQPAIGLGYSPVKTAHDILMFSLGLGLNSELATGGTTSTQSAEGIIGGSYERFRYDTPKTDIRINVTYYPSITEQGRYRLAFDMKVRRELIKDFFFDISFWTDYDSNGPSGTGEESDYGIMTSLGYTY